MGGESDIVLRRIARLADGWMPGGTLRTPNQRLAGDPGGYPAMVERLRRYVRDAGRDPAAVGMERRFNYQDGPEAWVRAGREWRALGGTHLSVSTMRAGLSSPRAHVEAICRVWDALLEAALV